MSTKPILFFLATLAFAQLPPAADWAAHAQNEYQVFPNITYLTATGYESKLDIYQRRDTATHPTLIFFHGGGWIRGTKEASAMSILPWLEMGWNVVNVEYRMARVALAPAAVEDGLVRCVSPWRRPRLTASTPAASFSAVNRRAAIWRSPPA